MASHCVVARPRGRFWRALNAIGLSAPSSVVKARGREREGDVLTGRRGGALADHESGTRGCLSVLVAGNEHLEDGHSHVRHECRVVVPPSTLRGIGTGLVFHLEFHRALLHHAA